MRPSVWAGSEASYYTFSAMEDKYSLDRLAYSRSPFDDEPETDPVFGVDSSRKGLSVLEMVGDTPVIKVHGSLVSTFRRYHTWFPGEVTSYEAINDALNIVSLHGSKKVLLDVNSPGGQVRGVDTVVKMIQRTQKAGTQVNGHSDGAAMSAAYWVLSTCNEVTGSRMAEFGSIGTMAVVRTFADTEKNMGVTFSVFKEGDFKAIGNPYEKLSDADKKYIQDDLKKANGFFLNHVSSNRMLDLGSTAEWAEGKTFYAGEALRNGLIDQVIDLDDLIGGASASTTGDIKVIGMKIDPKKLAQIEAGADPKTVLTAAEFKQYTAHLEEIQKEADAAAAAEALAAADALKKNAGGNEPGDEPKDPKPGTEVGTMAQDYRDALKANGRLENQVETLTTQLEAANTALASARAETTSLLVVAKHAVGKLQTAVGAKAEEKATAAEIVAQFNDLNAKMALMYPTSRQSSDSPAPEASGEPTAQEYRSLRQAQLNQR